MACHVAFAKNRPAFQRFFGFICDDIITLKKAQLRTVHNSWGHNKKETKILAPFTWQMSEVRLCG